MYAPPLFCKDYVMQTFCHTTCLCRKMKGTNGKELFVKKSNNFIWSYQHIFLHDFA